LHKFLTFQETSIVKIGVSFIFPAGSMEKMQKRVVFFFPFCYNTHINFLPEEDICL